MFPDFNCPNGGRFLILGDSGSGKTTMLHLMCGLLNARTGKVEINGVNLQSLGTKNLDHFRGKNIGVIFQKAHFVQSLTIKENLYLPSMLTKSAITSGELNVRSDELLLRLRLDHKANLNNIVTVSNQNISARYGP